MGNQLPRDSSKHEISSRVMEIVPHHLLLLHHHKDLLGNSSSQVKDTSNNINNNSNIRCRITPCNKAIKCLLMDTIGVTVLAASRIHTIDSNNVEITSSLK